MHAGALEAYSGATAKSGASFACVDVGTQLPDGSRVNTYWTGDAALTHLHARIVLAIPSATPAIGASIWICWGFSEFKP